MVQLWAIPPRHECRGLLALLDEYLNILISYANAPIIVWDPDYTITRINHAFEMLTGTVANKSCIFRIYA